MDADDSPNEAAGFSRVLAEELKRIEKSRKVRTGENSPPRRNPGTRVRTVRERAYYDGLIGLAFSGGGIRSATFNLGILQGLAKFGVLPAIDYLSTVSGGGYIGSWLHAWIQREEREGKPGIHTVTEALANVTEDRRQSAHPSARTTQSPEPVQYLRRYANYLTPRTGLLSTDTWTMISIWFRNTFLNQLILFLSLAALLMLPRALYWVAQKAHERAFPPLWNLLPVAIAVFIIGLNLSAFAQRPTVFARLMDRLGIGIFKRETLWFHQPGAIKSLVAAPMLAVAFLASAWLSTYLGPANHPRLPLETACILLAGSMAALQMIITVVGGLKQEFLDSNQKGATRAILLLIFFNLLTSSIGAGVLYLIIRSLQSDRAVGDNLWHVLVWGAPVLLAAFTLVVILQLGLLGRNFPDERREWWSRLGGTLFLFTIVWIVLFSMSVYGPKFVLWIRSSVEDAWASGLLMSWIGAVAAGLWASNNTKASNPDEANAPGWKSFLIELAPPLFILGIFLLLSTVLHRTTLEFLTLPEGIRNLYCPPGSSSCTTPSPGVLVQNHFAILSAFPSLLALIWAIGLAAASWLLAWRVDINEFSLHQFYRNRLVRCYLGASRKNRRPNLFTGFDASDSISLWDIDPEMGYSGPYAIFNTALNLVHGENLAWQERKAESFIFTPAFCGYDTENNRATHPPDRRNLEDSGYRPTGTYSEPGGPHVGMAAAISGAAASPNSGYHSSPSAAFLMTVFDVRLGWWIGNPRHQTGCFHSSPTFGLMYLIFELMGLTNDRRSFVYLSDGGHFENLGVYELVRRRCRYIICSDAEQDQSYQFEGLANAIRKCRTDFQVEIDLDFDRLRPSSDTQYSGAHCVVGTILYPEKDAEGNRLRGMLVYIKSTLTGDEPADLLEHRRKDPTFPHTSTADQWFSESQFESYRRLGLHVANSVFRDVAEDVPVIANREEFFRRLRQQWYPPARNKHRFTEHSRALTELMERLRQDSNLRFLHGQVSPEWPVLMGQASDPPKIQRWLPHTERELRAGFMFCNSIIQLMENVYIDLDLETQWDHPDHRGWMNVFNNWVWASMFRVTWAVSAACYGARFQAFCHKRLHLPLGELHVEEGTPEDLNDFEREERWEKVRQNGDKLWKLEMRVDNPAVGRQMVSFRFGFAVVDRDDCLAFYRVQNHLRKMGLWSGVEPLLRRAASIKGDTMRHIDNQSI